MKNLRPFQIGLLATFALLGVASVVLLAGFDIASTTAVKPYGDRVVIWGTLDQRAFSNYLIELRKDDKEIHVVEYQQKDPRFFENELVNAIAEGRSPDAIVLPHEELVKYRPKVQPLTYDTLPLRTLQDVYLDGFEIFALSDGVYALPWAVDPLLMYWNRDLLASAGLAEAPSSWELLVNKVAPKVTVRDTTRRELVQSTVAFGEYRNVNYAKEVMSTLIMQSGSKMVSETDRGYSIEIDKSLNDSARKPMEAAVQFYIDFGNANSALYSWNRSLPDDLTAFLAEDLALYFAPGSEASHVRALNPNFNFDAAPVPQGATATTKRTYGTFYGLAILKASPNKQGTYNALRVLGSEAADTTITTELGLAPAYRSLITIGSADPDRQLVFSQALIARGWLEPSPEETDDIWQQMVEGVISNRLKVNNAILDAVKRLQLAY